MENIKLFYDSKGINNYICARVETSLSRYQVKMLECNEIPGLLALHTTSLNGEITLHYDITKKQRLADVLGNEIKGNKAKQLLSDILKALLSAEEYLLAYNRCVLHPEYIYVGADNKVGMIYLPLEEMEVSSVEEIQSFYQSLLADYLTDDNDMYFLNLLRYVNKQGFSLAGLNEQLQVGMDKTAAAQEQPPVYRPSVSAGVMPEITQEPIKEEKNIKSFFEFPLKKEGEKKEKPEKQEKTKKEDTPIGLSGLGFMIPGMEKQQVKEENVVDKKIAKEEKASSKKPFGLFGGGKKNVEPEQKFPKEKQKVAFTERESSAQMQNNESTSGGWTGTVMLSQNGASTVILGAQATAQLIHNGGSVCLESFPFHIGNGKIPVDYVIARDVISRNHATIHSSQGRYYIKDENSANHTYVNGRQIPPYTETELHSGDVIRLANEELIFQE